MRVVIFGATGMIGYGVLLECLDDPAVEAVATVGRRAVDIEHDKLEQIVHEDFADFSAIEDRLSGFDACMWCLGVSAAGMAEEKCRRITVDFTLAAAEVPEVGRAMIRAARDGAATRTLENVDICELAAP